MSYANYDYSEYMNHEGESDYFKYSMSSTENPEYDFNFTYECIEPNLRYKIISKEGIGTKIEELVSNYISYKPSDLILRKDMIGARIKLADIGDDRYKEFIDQYGYSPLQIILCDKKSSHIKKVNLRYMVLDTIFPDYSKTSMDEVLNIIHESLLNSEITPKNIDIYKPINSID